MATDVYKTPSDALGDPDFQQSDRETQRMILRTLDKQGWGPKPDQEIDAFIKKVEPTWRRDAKTAQTVMEETASLPPTESFFKKYVANPMNEVVGRGMEMATQPLVSAARALNGEDLSAQTYNVPGTGKSYTREGALAGGPIGAGGAAREQRQASAKMIVPQSATEAGIMAGTALAGPVLGKVATAVPKLAELLQGAGNASRVIPAVARVGGAALGGALGGKMENVTGGEDTATAGALKGLLAGTAGEGLSYLSGKVARSMPGAAGRIEAQDTARIGQTIEDINPALRTVRNGATASDINAMAGLGGKRQLSNAYNEGVSDISREVSKVTPTINVPSMSGAVPFNAASQKLRDLNRAAHWDSLSPTDNMIAARDAARTLKKEIGHGLEAVDHLTGAYNTSGSLEGAWYAVNREFKEGQAIRDFLSRTGHYSGDTENMRLVTQKLQAALKDPKLAEDLEERLGRQNFDKLVKSITRGAERGAQDKLASEVAPLTARGLISLLTRSGLGGTAGTVIGGPIGGIVGGLAGATLLPNAAAKYAGRTPYVASNSVKTLADLLAGKAVSKATESKATENE